MHATLLTVLLVAGAQPPAAAPPQQPLVVAENCGRTDCHQCQPVYGCRGWAAVWSCLAAWCAPVPQTGCAPRFGCCPVTNRGMHSYPAFPGYCCRPAYDYRRLADYPWHAAAHEAPAFFTSQGHRPSTEEVIPAPYPEPESAPFEWLPPDAPD